MRYYLVLFTVSFCLSFAWQLNNKVQDHTHLIPFYGHQFDPLMMTEVVKAYQAKGPNYEVEICNNTEQKTVYASLAFYDHVIDAWLQRGWYAVEKGECMVPLKDLKGPVFAFAETTRRHVEWGGQDFGTEFCVHSNDRFTFRLDHCQALEDDSTLIRAQSYTQLPLSLEGGRFRWDLRE